MSTAKYGEQKICYFGNLVTSDNTYFNHYEKKFEITYYKVILYYTKQVYKSLLLVGKSNERNIDGMELETKSTFHFYKKHIFLFITLVLLVPISRSCFLQL